MEYKLLYPPFAARTAVVLTPARLSPVSIDVAFLDVHLPTSLKTRSKFKPFIILSLPPLQEYNPCTYQEYLRRLDTLAHRNKLHTHLELICLDPLMSARPILFSH